ncbi:hypothetical protein WE348_20050 (plasmid) [Alteromonas macleodii]|uniref:hypothetical protein n=1 Tax=Alteromonas macleodii TaxID=28108 RepID=UPI0030D295C1
MNRFLKNAAIVALLATPSGPAFSQELESMENATETHVLFSKGDVLSAQNNASSNNNYVEPLFVDAQTNDYINATDLYDAPRNIVGVYNEEIGYPKNISIEITNDIKSQSQRMLEITPDDTLTADDVKLFMVLREISKEFSLTYPTSKEILNSAENFVNLDNRDKAFIYQNETEVNCTALVLFSRHALSKDSEKGLLKLNAISKVLGDEKQHLKSSQEAMNDTIINLIINHNSSADKSQQKLSRNVRDLTRAIAFEYKDEQKEYYALLNNGEMQDSDEMFAKLNF